VIGDRWDGDSEMVGRARHGTVGGGWCSGPHRRLDNDSRHTPPYHRITPFTSIIPPGYTVSPYLLYSTYYQAIMPTVEDYFDDDTDLPLPSSSKPRTLRGTGIKGALLEEIGSEDEADMEMDYDRLAEQGRGVFGENSTAPPPSAGGNGNMTVREDPGDLRPTGQSGMNPNANTPMGGFMGDMMKLQQVEEERMAKLRQQFGNVAVSDPSVHKG